MRAVWFGAKFVKLFRSVHTVPISSAHYENDQMQLHIRYIQSTKNMCIAFDFDLCLGDLLEMKKTTTNMHILYTG